MINMNTLGQNKNSSLQEANHKKETKMEMMRRKMTKCRRKKESQEKKNITVIKASIPKTWKGISLKSARDSQRQKIQESWVPVLVGADVEALYPNLSDLDAALICYQAVIETEIEFQNINYKLATKYIAISMTAQEQRLSPLAGILPRRTTTSATRPGVTSLPGNDTNRSYPVKNYTKTQEKAIVATMVQIGVITMMILICMSLMARSFTNSQEGQLASVQLVLWQEL
jgi:hypothetical protein